MIIEVISYDDIRPESIYDGSQRYFNALFYWQILLAKSASARRAEPQAAPINTAISPPKENSYETRPHRAPSPLQPHILLGLYKRHAFGFTPLLLFSYLRFPSIPYRICSRLFIMHERVPESKFCYEMPEISGRRHRSFIYWTFRLRHAHYSFLI